MKSLTDCYTLSNGVDIPCIGFGTWKTPPGEISYQAVKDALSLGYRHIDTATLYGNEADVGKAIFDSGIKRDEIFVTTKLWNDIRGYDETITAFNQSLDRLGLDYVDLYLIHWPNPLGFRDCWQQVNAETWRAFEDLYRAGKTRAIGISNFWKHHIDALLLTAQIAPQVNQFRICPGDHDTGLVQYTRECGMLVEAYSPLGKGQVFDVPLLAELADKYRRSVAQLCLRWSLQMGYLPLPKSVSATRMKENAQVFDFLITDKDMQLITELHGVYGPGRNPDKVDF